MGIFEHLIGFLAVFLSLAAYAQTDKTRFLLFNSAAISAVGVNFYLRFVFDRFGQRQRDFRTGGDGFFCGGGLPGGYGFQ